MRIATLALVLLVTAGGSDAQAHFNPQPPPRGTFDLGFPSQALEAGEERTLTRTENLEVFLRCIVRQPNPPADPLGAINGQVVLVGPNRRGARSRLVDGVGYRRAPELPPGEIEWIGDAFAEGAVIASIIDVVQAVPDFDFRVGHERLFGTAILVQLDGDAERPCRFSLVIRNQRGTTPP